MKRKMIPLNHLQGNTLCTLLLCVSLACTACGAGKDGTPTADTEQNTAADDSETQEPPDTETDTSQDESSGAGSEDNIPETGENTGDAESDTTVSTFDSHITIETKSATEDKTADDGTVYLSKSYSYPVVTIEGNDAAAEKINADIQSRIDSFMAATEIEEWAKEGYDETISSDSEYPFLAYSDDLTITVQRADSNVISFTLTDYTFTGGAHGNYGTGAVNYNAKTGEKISFSDLSDDPAAFHEDTLSYNQKLAETESYQERMFSSDSIGDGTLESVLYADDVWYLSPYGLVFMSNPYALGPYAAGIIEFIIPYSDLAGMGFKDSYTYTNRLIMKLQDGETCHYDLNGDGQEDSICFRSESIENTDGTYGSLLHLTVNDTDFSESGSEDVKDYLTSFSWGEFFLYDMNVEDEYTELAVLAWESDTSDSSYYSYFFRYTKDGGLIYLGKSKGDVCDPTAEITVIK